MKLKKEYRIIKITIILTVFLISIGSGRILTSDYNKNQDGGINPLSSSGNADALRVSPSIFWVSDPVQPDEIVMVEGANWGDSPSIELSWLRDDNPGQPPVGDIATQKKTVIKPLQVTVSSVKFVIPSDWKPGVYSFQISANDLKSKPALVNAPVPWWQQGDWGKEASPGGWLRVFGRCLSMDGKATLALQHSGQTTIITPAKQDQWSIILLLPENMAEGEYVTWIHNGCGGPAAWKQVGTITIKAHPPLWKSDIFNICDYGAVANDVFDDGLAVQAALDAAGKNGGGIVLVPRGRFQINTTLIIPRFVLLKGEGKDLSQIYWRDRITPLETLIRGTNSFGIEDLSIMAVNHLAGITTDQSNKPGAGNVFLRRLYIYLNRFENADFKMVSARMKERYLESADQNLGAVIVGGENVQVTDCEIYSSHAPFRFNADWGLYTNNRCFEGGASNFISGTNVIFENNVVHGSQLGRGGGCYVRKNLYYAHNNIGDMPLHDAELFTTDVPPDAMVNFSSIDGAKVILEQSVDWNELTGRTWMGNLTWETAFFITLGKGAGQYRFVNKFKGKEAELNRPWDVLPDSNSTIILAPPFEHNMLIGNEFHDGSAVQSYCMGIDWVLAGNKFTRVESIKNRGHLKLPSWYNQYIDNEILVGSGTRGPWGETWPIDAHLCTIGEGSRGTVFRRNVLHNNSRIEIELNAWGYPRWNDTVRDVIIDNNIIRDADIGINVRGSNNGVLLWNNHFEQVIEPVTGLKNDIFIHPAEWFLDLLSADGLVPEKLLNTPIWQAALKRLENLKSQDPYSKEVLNDVRLCQAELAKIVANETPEEQSLTLLQALTGLTITENSSDELKSLLSDGTGGTANTNFIVSLPEWSNPVTISLSLPPLPGWKVINPSPAKINPGESVTIIIKLTIPAGVWGKPRIPLACKAMGTGWQLNGTGKVQLSSLSSTDQVQQWMVTGPFASDQPGELGDKIYPPQHLLNINAEYPGVEGKVSWKPMTGRGGIDLMKLFGSRKNGVAFAVTVIRTSKPTVVAITTNGSNSVTYLNNEIIGGPFRWFGNQKVSVILPEGDNVLLCGVAQTSNYWQLSVIVEAGPLCKPGDIQVLPVEKFSEVRALNQK